MRVIVNTTKHGDRPGEVVQWFPETAIVALDEGKVEPFFYDDIRRDPAYWNKQVFQFNATESTDAEPDTKREVTKEEALELIEELGEARQSEVVWILNEFVGRYR